MRTLGKYFIFMGSLFVNRERFRAYIRVTVDECIRIGVDSVFIVAITGTFIGAVATLQIAFNLGSPATPMSVVGTFVREMILLEFAPTFTCIILAGKVGSNIAGSLGNMRISEQIDAIEVMGVNAASYLVLPKIVAALLTIPMLCALSAFLSILGGYIAASLTSVVTPAEYIWGVRFDFATGGMYFAGIKVFTYAFLMSSISSFNGFFTRGGALEVGQSSTKAVTRSTIAILFADYLLALAFADVFLGQ